jgi:hypothetical protein
MYIKYLLENNFLFQKWRFQKQCQHGTGRNPHCFTVYKINARLKVGINLRKLCFPNVKDFLIFLDFLCIWTLADCLVIKYMGRGDVFNNGCDLIFALSTAALTGQLVVSGFLWDKRTVLGAKKALR